MILWLEETGKLADEISIFKNPATISMELFLLACDGRTEASWSEDHLRWRGIGHKNRFVFQNRLPRVLGLILDNLNAQGQTPLHQLARSAA